MNLKGTDIDDEALESLIPAIVSNRTMRTLDLSSIYYFLVKSLIPLLESSNLTELKMERRQNVDDEDARMFAIALAGNHTMKAFLFDSEQLVKGWDYFSRLLCKKHLSSISATYNSNHTLQELGKLHGNGQIYCTDNIDEHVVSLLRLNCGDFSKRQIGVGKILKYHPNMDFESFFDLDLKLLHHAITWFDNAATYPDELRGSDRAIQMKKMLAIYQFLRNVPIA